MVPYQPTAAKPPNWRRNAQLWTQYDRMLRRRIQTLPRDLVGLLREFIPPHRRKIYRCRFETNGVRAPTSLWCNRVGKYVCPFKGPLLEHYTYVMWGDWVHPTQLHGYFHYPIRAADFQSECALYCTLRHDIMSFIPWPASRLKLITGGDLMSVRTRASPTHIPMPVNHLLLFNGLPREENIIIQPPDWQRNAQLWTQYDRTLKLRIRMLPRDLQCLLAEFIPRRKQKTARVISRTGHYTWLYYDDFGEYTITNICPRRRGRVGILRWGDWRRTTQLHGYLNN